MNHIPANTSRREFFRRTATAAAMLGIPHLIPSGVLAAPGRLGPNDRIGIGGIGVGRQGSGIVGSTFGKKDTRIVAVADVNVPRAQELAKKWGAAEVYEDYRKLLERKDVDAVMTATPEHWRVHICVHACQAGKDIYAEKPLTLTIREGRMISDAARKYDRVFQVGSLQRSMAPNRLGCEMIRNGRIGKLKKIIAHNYPSPWYCNLPAQPIPTGLNWDMWCGPTELVPYNLDLYTPRAKPGWISFQPFSGGEMTGWGSHGLDQVQWALGMDDSGPVEVWTEGDRYAPPTYDQPEPRKRGETICGNPKVFFRYANDVVVELGEGPLGGAIFIGEKGSITIDRDVCKADPEEILKEPIRDDEIHLPVSANHVTNWIECIRSREKPVCDVEAGHRTATMCHLGNIARWTGRRLQWDPAKEQFTNDAQANEYLDRKRRKPYEAPETI